MSVLLSICIPTYNRKEHIDTLLESIYSQDANMESIEVCITDDSDNDETEKLITDKYSNISNLKYQRVPNTGYMNLIRALQFGNGALLKLHNDYSIFCEDSLNKMIEVAKNHLGSKDIIFFRGDKRGTKQYQRFQSFDSFLYCAGIALTWSTSFAIWKEDFDYLINLKLPLNKFFPHVSLIFQLANRKIFIIDDSEYYKNINIKKKGGYNLPEVFFDEFLNMAYNLKSEGKITKKTVNHLKIDIINFTSYWKAKSNCNNGITYDFNGDKEIVLKHCGRPLKALYESLYIIRLLKYKIID